MGLLMNSCTFRFYKKHAEARMSNPLRRYFYHYLFGACAVGTVGSVVLMYQLAGWEAKKYGSASNRFVCPSGVMDVFLALPSNRISNFVGTFAEAGPLSSAVHRILIDLLVRLFRIDVSESREVTFGSLQDFYTREWGPECRPVHRDATVVCPCDGVIVELHEGITGDRVFQVKGNTYGIRSLFQVAPPQVPEGFKRVAVVIRLRLADFHHVVAPASFCCEESIYVPGTLLPTTMAGYHWLPGVLALNERVVVRGKCTDKAGKGGGSLFLAMVGSTLTGKIKLHFDERVRTNFLDPPDYAIFSKYGSRPLLTMGTPVGVFLWGSSLVLMVDVPQTTKLQFKRGDAVKAGEALLS